jgi:hypothetical protein
MFSASFTLAVEWCWLELGLLDPLEDEALGRSTDRILWVDYRLDHVNEAGTLVLEAVRVLYVHVRPATAEDCFDRRGSILGRQELPFGLKDDAERVT